MYKAELDDFKPWLSSLSIIPTKGGLGAETTVFVSSASVVLLQYSLCTLDFHFLVLPSQSQAFRRPLPPPHNAGRQAEGKLIVLQFA